MIYFKIFIYSFSFLSLNYIWQKRFEGDAGNEKWSTITYLGSNDEKISSFIFSVYKF